MTENFPFFTSAKLLLKVDCLSNDIYKNVLGMVRENGELVYSNVVSFIIGLGMIISIIESNDLVFDVLLL